jgi:alcohol dehydrogenase (NADP+)
MGRVRRVGASVTKLAVGDMAGVGCMVGACLSCRACRAGMEQFCVKQCAWTYNGTEMDRAERSARGEAPTPTFGGYSTEIVVPEHFVMKVPEGLDPACAAPLLCAGITTYSPLRRWNCKQGDRVAVVGLGGLGHVAVKLAAAMGAEVTVLSTSKKKEPDAKKLGAHEFAVTSEKGALEKLAGRFDLVLDTVSAEHDYNAYLGTLKPGGTMIVVGVPPAPTPVSAFSLIGGNRNLAGSLIGGAQETQEMIDYCAAKGIVAEVEVIPVQKINEAYDRMLKNDVHYRFVIDIASLR